MQLIDSHPYQVHEGELPSTKGLRPGWKRLLAALIPGALGLGLFVFNNLDVVHSLIAPPPGYVSLGIQRNGDVAQYLTWLAGLRTAWILPNYHAPWSTPPGLIVPGLVPVALLMRFFSLNPIIGLQLLSLAGYIFTAYTLAFAYKTFCRTRRQALWSLLLALCCVPISSLPGFAHLLRAHSQYGDAMGRIQFMITSDGFLRGLVTWPFLTFGTGFQVLSMSLLARYCNSRGRKWLGWLALVCLVSAVTHPFEIVVTITAVGIVLLRSTEPFAKNLKSLGVVLVAAAVGLLPYLIESRRTPWIHEITVANRTADIMPSSLLAMLGAPALLVVALLLLGFPDNSDHNAVVLKTWFSSTLLLFFAPGMPWALHLLDGLFVAIGLLLVSQAQGVFIRWPVFTGLYPRLLVVPLLLGSLYPHVSVRLRAWGDGTSTQDSKFRYPSALSPVGESEIIQWLRVHAKPDSLALATEEAAPWIASAPVHSFGSHWLFSLLVTHPRYGVLRNSFFDGSLTADQAHEFLATFGVRFIIVPDASPARKYLGNAVLRGHFTSNSIYEFPEAQIKNYGDAGILALGSNPEN